MIEPSKLTVTECINLIQDKEVSVTELTATLMNIKISLCYESQNP